MRKLTAVLGRDISGEIVVTDIAKMLNELWFVVAEHGKHVCVYKYLSVGSCSSADSDCWN